jgi:hypothetical protein
VSHYTTGRSDFFKSRGARLTNRGLAQYNQGSTKQRMPPTVSREEASEELE